MTSSLKNHLTRIKQGSYKGRSICKGRNNKELEMFKEYLDRIEQVIEKTTSEYSRVTAVRVDLKFPSTMKYEVGNVIKRFIGSLKSQIEVDIKRKRREGKRTPRCNVRYIWVKENKSSINDHYHCVLFFNKDVYAYLGDYRSINNLAYKIQSSWCRALDLDIDEGEGLVHFPKHAVYWLNRRENNFEDQFDQLFKRLSYFAKSETKKYGDRRRSFGCSQR
ncbi:inovirus Gp2 family protein [Vibrio metschnikovii]|uniref:inovirus Gp2 family protein n=1 Tax=Vibrio metschnikovii TaxID=28172 RepID=UPI001E57907E|nr:inovirus Gp2 family protein [Vibrio metschnikovii]